MSATLPHSPPIEPTLARRPAVRIPQYTHRGILSVWAAAALPMAVLAWIAAPILSHQLPGPAPLGQAIIVCLTAGLIWQFVLVAGLVYHEQGTLRWPVVREALWLRAPREPGTDRRSRRAWLLLIPLVLGFGAEELIPSIAPVAGHDYRTLLDSHAGHALLSGAWGWLAVITTLCVFNTVLGEELLFRGLLLPRMQGAYGDRDYAANGVLFAFYHLHMPWAIPATLLDTFFVSYPSRRYRSAWMGIAVHSAQSLFVVAGTLVLVLR